jgi:outer membrane protein assembly factor BamB
MKRMGLAAAALALLAAPASAGDWPGFRGPDRSGASAETGWQADWQAHPPRPVWKASVGSGYSAVSVAGGLAYTMGNAGGQDTVWALDAATGDLAWRFDYPCRSPSSNPGPRSTPLVDSGAVFALSRYGLLHALDARTGRRLWQQDLVRVLGAKAPGWGLACSPLAYGDAIIIDVGTAAAFNRKTGAKMWASPRGATGYSSPVLFKAGARTLLATFPEYGLRVLDPSTGAELAAYPWSTSYGVNAPAPLVADGTLFITSGYRTGCALLALGPRGLVPIYANKSLAAHFHSPVLFGGHVYGFSGNAGGGDLRCLDLKSGALAWSKGGLQHGSLILADGKLIALGEAGDLVLIQADPAAYRELGRAKVLSGQCWTMPVLANGRIYCRNTDGDLVCLDVRKDASR